MYSPLRHIGSVFWKKRPIHLTFFVTRRCNSKCPFCFYLKTASDNEAAKKELTLDEISRISESMGKLLWLAFSGGEIFLRDDLIDISDIFYRNNKPSIMLYPTNGMLPKLISNSMVKILERCKKSIITLKLSIDGIGENHDMIRNTPGSFEKTMQTYHLLKILHKEYPNFELGVNTVFCSQNQDEIEKIIDFVSTMQEIRTHTISMVRGDLSRRDFKEIDHYKYYMAIEYLENRLKNKMTGIYSFKGAKLKAAQDIIQRRLIYKTVEEKRRLIPCYAGRLNIVLSECGDVYPCEILNRSFGNVREYDYDIKRVLESDRAIGIKRSIKNKECFCTHECYFMTNILFNPLTYPMLTKEYLRL